MTKPQGITIPNWLFSLVGPLVFIASLIASYSVNAATTKEHSKKIELLEHELATLNWNLARLCERLEVECR